MSALGQKQTFAVQNGMSALPPKADIRSASVHVRFVLLADIRNLIPGTDWTYVQLTQSFAQANDGASQRVEIKRRVIMSKVRMYILAAVATAGIGLGGTFGVSAVPINGKLIGATAPAPELHKV
jgi:hypothetical protein